MVSAIVRFHYMAMSDERQRVMPTPEDRSNGEPLAYPEAVLITNPSNPQLKGEVRSTSFSGVIFTLNITTTRRVEVAVM